MIRDTLVVVTRWSGFMTIGYPWRVKSTNNLRIYYGSNHAWITNNLKRRTQSFLFFAQHFQYGAMWFCVTNNYRQFFSQL